MADLLSTLVLALVFVDEVRTMHHYSFEATVPISACVATIGRMVF